MRTDVNCTQGAGFPTADWQSELLVQSECSVLASASQKSVQYSSVQCSSAIAFELHRK